MERALRYRPGGIASLDILIEAYPDAIKKDLIDRGLRLRDLCLVDDLNWDDLRAVIAAADPDSAIARAIRGSDWQWGLQEMLLAAAVDYLALLWWSKTKSAQRNQGHPKPIPRPGVAKPERIGDKPVSIGDMNKFLGWEVAA